MEGFPLLSHVEHTYRLLADLHDRFSSLTPDQQAILCSELDRFSETLKQYLLPDGSQAALDQSVEQITDPNHPLDPILNRSYRNPMGMVLLKANAGIFVRNLVKKTVTWSPELYELLGIDPSIPSQTSMFMDMIHPDDRPGVEAGIQAAIDRGGTFCEEFRVILPDGKQIWLSSIGFIEKDASGQPLTLTGVNQDITPRKAAEQALEAAHAEAVKEQLHLRAVLEAMPIGVAILDAKGGVIQANPEYDEIWGGPRPTAQSVEDFYLYKARWAETGQPIAPQDWAAAQALKTGHPVTNQFLEIERFDGSHRTVLNSAAPTHDAQGQLTGCVVAIRDITARVEAEKALLKSERSRRESEERLRVVISSLPLTVYMLDKEMRYTWVYNPQYGMTPEQMLGKRDNEIYPNITADFIDQLRSAIESGQGYQREIKTEIFGNSKVFVLSIEPFYNEHGTITGLIGVRLDVTEQRWLEMERQEVLKQIEIQKQLVQNREKERQDIAREIHDGPIQTLVSMMFNLQIAKEVANQPEIREEMEQVSTGLKGAIRELRDVVNNLRAPALLRLGLDKALNIYVEDFREKHPEIKLQVLYNLPGDGLNFSEENVLALYRLCQEGLSNIARHARATQAWITFDYLGDEIMLEIRDNGQGFQVPADLNLNATKGHFGLSGMQERVLSVGGEFLIASSPGTGTRIAVKIPYKMLAPA